MLALLGLTLGGFAVYEVIAAAQAAIANENKARLQSLLPYASSVGESLASISVIWADITTALSDFG